MDASFRPLGHRTEADIAVEIGLRIAGIGRLEFECQVLHIAETGQRLIAYCAAPGSATEAAFRELAASALLPI